jgi:signal transduction histidine kinase
VRERSVPVLRSVRRLAKLADELLDVARIRGGRLRLELEPVELGSLVREVAPRTAEGLGPSAERSADHRPAPGGGRWDPDAARAGGHQPGQQRLQVRRGASRSS